MLKAHAISKQDINFVTVNLNLDIGKFLFLNFYVQKNFGGYLPLIVLH